MGKLVVGNWKMHKTPNETTEFISKFALKFDGLPAKPMLCVPFVCIPAAVLASEKTGIAIGAQNCHFENHGAFTGEISAQMLAEGGATAVIVGHSERRMLFGETDEIVNKKLHAALGAGLSAILCVGESETQRSEGRTNEVLGQQTSLALKNINVQNLQKIILAYEPIWAIGTGRAATLADATTACSFLRQKVEGVFPEYHRRPTVLYGGSANEKNAAEILAQPEIDGILVGGGSLDVESFAKIVMAAGAPR